MKEEIPIPAHEPGDVTESQVVMGQFYNNQIFYNLNYNSVISENLETGWEIAFDCSDTSSHVILNSSLVCSAYKTTSTNFENINSSIDIDEIDWSYDATSGNLDSLALKNYNDGSVFIINLGSSVSEEILNRGYKKILISKPSEVEYQIRSANLDGTMDTTVIISKDSDLNFIAYSLVNNSAVEVFPNKNSWDLMFTAYNNIFTLMGSPYPYRVSGVLINRKNTYVAEDIAHNFEDINYEMTQNDTIFNFIQNIDVIGYDWKDYSHSVGSFTIRENLNYVIKTSSGLYFKLRFLDFYNSLGEKGCPKFEFQKL